MVLYENIKMEQIRTEHEECVIFVKYLKTIKCLYSKIPLEVWTPSYWQIQKQKAEGLNSWLPDYVIIVRCCSWKKKIVFVEMKKQKGWVVSSSQKIRIDGLLECWINATVSRWAIEAIKYIQKIIAEN